MDANPTRTEALFQCDVRQGNTMVTIDGSFNGTAAEAKAMIFEILGKISKTNFQTLAKR